MTGKVCTRCKAYKPYESYSMHFRMSDHRQSQCKACFAERACLYRKGKPCISCGMPKGFDIQKGAKLCRKCSETCFECHQRPRKKQHRLCNICQSKRNRIRNSCPERKLRIRLSKIKSVYKITDEEAMSLLSKKQCEACLKTFTKKGDAHIDHCHKTGKVRGVLCFNCNASMGHLGDSLDRMNKLCAYLMKHSLIELEYGA